ncbi:hypothetical protein HDU89_006367 [Geranomyces variabilis]|nr:hypothetical protein HDU89_006367 [Geranomyces variabilis]
MPLSLANALRKGGSVSSAASAHSNPVSASYHVRPESNDYPGGRATGPRDSSSSAGAGARPLLTHDDFFPESQRFPPAPPHLQPPAFPTDESFLALTRRLDITRITDRVISAGMCWAQRTDKRVRRNNVGDLARFVNTRYPGRYMVWNLAADTSQGIYDITELGHQVVSFPFSKAYSLSVSTLFEVCRSIHAWLELDPLHVALVQCPTGLGRSAVAISCYLRYADIFTDGADALDYFIDRRWFKSNPERDLPSWATVAHRRYVQYFHNMLILGGVLPNPLPLVLQRVVVNGIEPLSLNSPNIELYQSGKLMYSTVRPDLAGGDLRHSASSNSSQATVRIDSRGNLVFRVSDASLLLGSDIQLRLFHTHDPVHHPTQVSTIASLSFHAGFMLPGVIRVGAKDLEISEPARLALDKVDQRDPQSSFCFYLMFAEHVPVRSSTTSSTSGPSSSASSLAASASYLGMLDRRPERCLPHLVSHHAVKPKEEAVTALMRSGIGYSRTLAIFALQRANCDVRSALYYIQQSQIMTDLPVDDGDAATAVLPTRVSQSSQHLRDSRSSSSRSAHSTDHPPNVTYGHHRSLSATRSDSVSSTRSDPPPLPSPGLGSQPASRDQKAPASVSRQGSDPSEPRGSHPRFHLNQQQHHRYTPTNQDATLITPQGSYPDMVVREVRLGHVAPVSHSYEQSSLAHPPPPSHHAAAHQNHRHGGALANSSVAQDPIRRMELLLEEARRADSRADRRRGNTPLPQSDADGYHRAPPRATTPAARAAAAAKGLDELLERLDGERSDGSSRRPRQSPTTEVKSDPPVPVAAPPPAVVAPPPPPPPPPAPPPPPPPPLPSSSNAEDPDVPAKPRARARIHWDEIRDIEGSVWSEISSSSTAERRPSIAGGDTAVEDVGTSGAGGSTKAANSGDGGVEQIQLNIQRFEELFCVVPEKAGKDRPKMVQRTQFTNLLDLRRANNVSIGLSRFTRRGLDTAALITAVRTMNATVLSPDDLSMLQKLLPTPDECAMLTAYLAKPADPTQPPLAPAERFMSEVMAVPHMRDMCTALHTATTVGGDMDDAENKLDTMVDLSAQLRTNDNLKTLLRSVLELGNLTNYDYSANSQSFRPWMGKEARAIGLKVDGLARLKDVKSRDGKWSLMTFLVDMVAASRTDVLDVPAEVHRVRVVAKWDLEVLVKGFRNLKAVVAALEGVCTTDNDSGPDWAEYVTDRLQPLIASVSARIASVMAKADAFRAEFERLARYLGEDVALYVDLPDALAGTGDRIVPSTLPVKKFPTHLFAMMHSFLDAYEGAVADWRRRGGAERTREMQYRPLQKSAIAAANAAAAASAAAAAASLVPPPEVLSPTQITSPGAPPPPPPPPPPLPPAISVDTPTSPTDDVGAAPPEMARLFRRFSRRFLDTHPLNRGAGVSAAFAMAEDNDATADRDGEGEEEEDERALAAATAAPATVVEEDEGEIPIVEDDEGSGY